MRMLVAFALLVALCAASCSHAPEGSDAEILTPDQLAQHREALDGRLVTVAGYIGVLPRDFFYLGSGVSREENGKVVIACRNDEAAVFPIWSDNSNRNLKKLIEVGLRTGEFKKAVITGIFHNSRFVLPDNLVTNTYTGHIDGAKVVRFIDETCRSPHWN